MDPQPTPDARQILKVCRIIWFGLIIGVVTTGAVFAFLIARRQGGTMRDDQQTYTIFLYLEIFMTVMGIATGLFVRGQVFKAGWVGDVVKPMSYQTGNIIAWAMCEGPAFFGIITCFLAGTFWPYALPPAVSLLMLVLLWPNGRAMFPPRDPYAPRTGER